MKTLFGVVCATITPMDASGEIDDSSLCSLCDYLVECGINGIYPNGTNGGGVSLSAAERKHVAKVMVKHNGGRMSAFIQTTAMTTKETCEHAKHAAKIGADGIGIMTPIFFPHDDLALEQFYDDVVAMVPTDFPVYLYNIPQFAVNNISPALLSKIVAKHQNVRGVKFSMPNLMMVEDYLLYNKPGLDVLIGCDSLFLQCLITGGVGTVSGPAMVFGKRFARLYSCYLDRNFEEAAEVQRRIVDTDRRLQKIPAIPAIKSMLKMQGVIKNDTCRKPFRALEKDELKVLADVLKQYNAEG